MEKRDEYNKIIEKYEGQYTNPNINLHKKCLEDFVFLNKKMEEKLSKLYGDNEQKFNTIHIEILKESKNTLLFYRILEKYKYNAAISILWFLSDICDTNYEPTEKYLIDLYEKSPYITKITKEGNTFKIHTILGSFPFWKIQDYLLVIDNQNLKGFYENECISGYCHANTTKATKILENSIATTALCKAAFIGTYYHSFTIYKGNCIDFNYNCVIPYEAYRNLVNATILNQIPHHKLEEELYPFQNWEEPLFYKTIDKQLHSFSK